MVLGAASSTNSGCSSSRRPWTPAWHPWYPLYTLIPLWKWFGDFFSERNYEWLSTFPSHTNQFTQLNLHIHCSRFARAAEQLRFERSAPTLRQLLSSGDVMPSRRVRVVAVAAAIDDAVMILRLACLFRLTIVRDRMLPSSSSSWVCVFWARADERVFCKCFSSSYVFHGGFFYLALWLGRVEPSIFALQVTPIIHTDTGSCCRWINCRSPSVRCWNCVLNALCIDADCRICYVC